MIVNTKYGPIDDSQLREERTKTAVEYYLKNELVHRSVTVQLKGCAVIGATQNFTRQKDV